MLNAHTFETLYLSALISPASKVNWNRDSVFREPPLGPGAELEFSVWSHEEGGVLGSSPVHTACRALYTHHLLGNIPMRVVREGFLQARASLTEEGTG